MFALYAFGPCRSQCNQTLQGILFRPGEGQGILFDPKFWPPGCLGTLLLEYHSRHSIKKVRACDYFLNNSRTKEDKDLWFSPFDTTDSGAWKYAKIWLTSKPINQVNPLVTILETILQKNLELNFGLKYDYSIEEFALYRTMQTRGFPIVLFRRFKPYISN